MAHGLEIHAASGAPKLTITDRLTRVVRQDNPAYWSWSYVGGVPSGDVRFFAVTGMADDGSWLVMVPWNDVIAWVGSGGYYVKMVYDTHSGYATFPVTIYRC